MNQKIEIEKIRKWVVFACKACDCPELGCKIPIYFNSRFTAKLGRARMFYTHNKKVLSDFYIEFAAKIWPTTPEDCKRNTAIHEACHVIEAYLYGWHGGKPHGVRWKTLMRQCGEKPERTFKLKDVGCEHLYRPQKRYVALCGCEGKKHNISAKRRGMIANNTRQYKCRICKQRIMLSCEHSIASSVSKAIKKTKTIKHTPKPPKKNKPIIPKVPKRKGEK